MSICCMGACCKSACCLSVFRCCMSACAFCLCSRKDFGKSTRVLLLRLAKAEMQNVVISQIVANGEGCQPAPSPATPAGSNPSPSKFRKMCADKWIKIESPVKSADDTKDTNAMAAFHMVCSACEDIIGQQQLVTPVFSTIRAKTKHSRAFCCGSPGPRDVFRAYHTSCNGPGLQDCFCHWQLRFVWP